MRYGIKTGGLPFLYSLSDSSHQRQIWYVFPPEVSDSMTKLSYTKYHYCVSTAAAWPRPMYGCAENFPYSNTAFERWVLLFLLYGLICRFVFMIVYRCKSPTGSDVLNDDLLTTNVYNYSISSKSLKSYWNGRFGPHFHVDKNIQN